MYLVSTAPTKHVAVVALRSNAESPKIVNHSEAITVGTKRFRPNELPDRASLARYYPDKRAQ